MDTSRRADLVVTRLILQYTWRNGSWDEGRFVTDPMMPMHVASVAVNVRRLLVDRPDADSTANPASRVSKPSAGRMVACGYSGRKSASSCRARLTVQERRPHGALGSGIDDA